MNRPIRRIFAAAFSAAAACVASAQINYNGGVYRQTFDALPGTTNNTLNQAWTDNVTLPGWYANKATFSVTDGTVGGTAATFAPTAAANPSNVGLFSFGTAASADRALGSRASAAVAGNDPVLYGVRLVNNTGGTLTSFTVTFTGEQWFKTGKTTADTIMLDYQIGATGITSGTWTNASGGTFTSLINTATAATVAGNTAANRRGVAVKITGVTWAAGQELWLRFRDTDEIGDEQAMAIDDFHFIADNESGLFFNGSTAYMTMGFGATAASLNASSFTIECRFMRTGPGVTASTGTGGVTTAIPLVAKGVGEADNSPVDANYFLGIDNATGRLCADFEQRFATTDPNGNIARAAGQNFPVFGSTVLQNGVFYHVAATYDTATAVWKLYVNGVAETTTQTLPTFVTVVPNDVNTQGLGIGTTINSTGARAGFFHGIIDEVRIWNVARSAADILANIDTEIAAAPGLLGRYGLDEAAGTTAAGTNATGGAAPVGTLGGTTLPVWANAKALAPNIAPTVAITAPASGSSVTFPAAITFSADAADSDGNIVKVEFFNGAVKIGEDLTGPAPYTFAWTNAAVGGPYSITAVATDNGGTATTSAAIIVSVNPNPNQPPVVSLTAPADNATGVGASINLQLSIADPDAADAQTVTFYGRKTTPAAPGADFTIATLPDTQFYSENLSGRGATFSAQTQWLLDNRNSALLPNLAFVSHMGDIVEHGDAAPAEWVVADGALKLLENPATAFRAHGIPWGAAPGNHDQTVIGSAGGANVLYNQYLGASRYAGRHYWGGSQSPLNNHNNYQLFSASGLDFIIIHLEYDTRALSFYQSVLDWADALLKAHPNRRAIITSHWIVNTGNPASFSTQGQNIYDQLKDNPNLFLMLCGHVAGEGRRTDVFEGRTVHSVLQDYQGRTNGGDGWLRYFVFSPANNTIAAKTYRVSNPVNPAAGGFETDADSEFVLAYHMNSAVTGWIPLGSVNVPAAGTTAALNWTGLEKSSDYEWYATVNDGINTVTTATRRFATVAAVAPTVTLTGPANGASFNVPATIELTADANDADGTIARVEFHHGGVKLGEDTTVPYSFTWSGVTSGSYTVTSTAIDDSGRATLSNLVTFSVVNPSNVPPTVALTAPADSASVTAPFTLTATASDSDGTVTKVEFFQGTTKLGEALAAPYSFTWTGAAPGPYVLKAVATDNDGGVATSALVNVTVVPAGAFAGSYTQDFDGMGTGTAPPARWSFYGVFGGANNTFTDAIPITGASVVGGTLNNALTAATTFTTSSNTAGFNFALPAATTDRALGTSPTSGQFVALQLSLTNATAGPISALRIGYDIRRFTAPATANELPGYWLFYSLDNGATWTNVAALNPTLANVPNTVGVTTIAPATVALAAPWAAGADILFRWIDDNAVATSPDQIIGLDNLAITLPVGNPPTVALVTPAAGATLVAPATIALSASAADSDGTIAKVEFYNGATKLGEDLTGPAPYTFDWTSVPVGSYSLTARATDNSGNTTTSAAVSVTVNATAGSGTLARGPYLNSPSDTSIVVRWRSTQAIVGRVRYGLTPGALTLFTDEVASRTDHEVKLTGLTPYTRYYYSVGSATDTLTPEAVDTTSVTTAAFVIPAPTANDYTFRTSPVPGTAMNTRIWVVGDCGRGSASQAGGRDAYYNFVNTSGRVPDFILMLGDNAYNSGTDAEYQSGYFLMYPTIFRKAPQWSTLGNHDANNGSTSPTANFPYFDMFTFPVAGEVGGVASGTERYYSFDYGNVHVVCLDSQASSRNTIEANGSDGPMAAWLRLDLASTTKTWIIVIYHHPEYSKGSHDSDTETQMVEMRQRFAPILDAGGADLVLTGHSHSYERSILVDGHYGLSGTITNAMKRNAGNGSTTGITTGGSGVIRNAASGFAAIPTVNGAVVPADGAYVKPLTGPRDHFGTVHVVNGSGGQADGGGLNHTAMYVSYNTVGTLNLDINGNTLVGTYVQSGGTTPDNFTIVKQGAADTDADGIPDAYEIANGLNRFSAADALLDLDGDGLKSGLEYALGDTANSVASAAVPTQGFGTGPDAGKLTLTFNRAREEVTYTVQASNDLVTWTDLAVNPGAVGGNVTVTDIVVGGLTRFLRLKVQVGPNVFNTVPVGALKTTLAGGTAAAPVTTVFGVALDDTSIPSAGIRAGRIEFFTGNSITHASAGWTGNLASPAAPWAVRITSGPAAGKLLDVTANTPATLTVGGVDLTTLGLTAGTDTFELIPMDTLATLFGGGTLLGGTSGATADNVQVRSGASWLAYFYDTNLGFWRRTIGPATNSNNVIVRPLTGVQIVRRGAATTLTFAGRVPANAFRAPINNASTTVIHAGFPTTTLLSALAVQTRLPGWTTADTVSLFNGTAWIGYSYNGTFWQTVVGAVNSDAVAIPAGALLTIQRPGVAAGTTDLVRPLPYSP